MRICGYEKCRRETKSLIKGYCPTCYAVYRRTGSPERERPNRSLGVTRCSNPDCESTDGPFVRSLCRPCYQRQYKTGSVARQRVRQLCKQPTCNEPVHEHGLCQMHAMRVRRHGDPDAGRPEGWGAKTKHPLYEGWQSMRRISSRAGHPGRDPRWDDFWTYIDDVGEPVIPKSRLYRIDKSKPYGPDNCEWRAPILDGATLGRNAEWQRQYAARHPDRAKAQYLWRNYKITLERYEELWRQQNGACAICGRPETAINPKTGNVFLLAVDHDHGPSKAVRGLLCMRHNRGLGMFGDSTQELEWAIAYLERHSIAPETMS